MSDVQPQEIEERSAAPQLFPDLLEQYAYELPKRGDFLTGEILGIQDDALLLTVGSKRDAVVPRRELDQIEEDVLGGLSRGDTVPVYVTETPRGDDMLEVSLLRGLEKRDWDRAEACLESGEILEVEVIGFNKGGLLARFGRIQAFIPNSHITNLYRASQRKNYKAELRGEKVGVRVLSVERRRRRLVLSMKEAAKEQRLERLKAMSVGEIVDGRVIRIVDFGAFVDIGDGVVGLAHISNLAWRHLKHPSEVVSEGDEIKLQVDDIDLERERLSLNRQVLLPNPWREFAEAHSAGDRLTGTISNLTDFGAFVEVAPGVEGLIHISEFDSWLASNYQSTLNLGDQVLVAILDIDTANERLSLSMRRVSYDEEVAWLNQQRGVTA